ncbi:MAG: sigma-70 family RNA polymerase sigma factor [Planctomycetota bacterium]
MSVSATRTVGRTGDAPDTWVDRHGDYLFRFAMHRVGDPSRAEELVQETFLAALQARSSFDGRSAFRSWLTGILKHKVADHFRRRASDPGTAEEQRLEQWCEERFDARGKWRKGPTGWQRLPEAPEERHELTRTLTGCLEKLPAQVAELFVLHEQRGVRTDRLAAEVGCTAGTLRVRLYRARVALRECLDRHWFGEPAP